MHAGAALFSTKTEHAPGVLPAYYTACLSRRQTRKARLFNRRFG
jgi:hypothetical protein